MDEHTNGLWAGFKRHRRPNGLQTSALAVAVAAAACLGASCADIAFEESDGIGQHSYEDGVGGGDAELGEMTSALRTTSRWVAAKNVNGDVVIFDGDTGEVVARSPSGDQFHVDDIAWTPDGAQVLTFERSEDGDWGEVASYGVAKGTPELPWMLSQRHAVSYLDGLAQLWPTSHGTVLFEYGYGTRWRLIGVDGFQPSVNAPLPVSIFDANVPDQPGFTALTYGKPGYAPQYELVSASVGEGGLTVGSPQVLDASASDPPTGRFAPAPFFKGGVIAHVLDGRVHLQVLRSDSEAPLPNPLALEAERVERIIGLSGGEWVALALGGPDQLAVVQTAGPQGAPAAVLALSGNLLDSAPFFSRQVQQVGEHSLLVATDQGVARAVFQLDEGGPTLAWDPDFQGEMLRGPLAVWEGS